MTSANATPLRSLGPADLCRSCEPERFSFVTTEELPDLALELGKLSEAEIRQWLADPMSVGPRVNCKVGTFTTERQVQDLIHYLQRRAQNPVETPVMTHEPIKRSTIRLLRSQAVVRERIRVREEIRRMNRGGLRPAEPPTPVRGPAPEGN